MRNEERYLSLDYKQLLEERLALAMKGTNDGVWDWNIKEDTVYFDPRWKEMIGYKDDELENKVSTWSDRIHPDDLQDTWETIQKHLDSDTEYYEGVHRLKHKNGSWVLILDRGKALYNDEGKPIRMIGTHTDITNKNIEKLNAVHQKQIIEEIHDSVISTDLDGNILNWNSGSEILLDYSKDEAIGQHVSMIYLKEDFLALEKNIETLMETGKNYSTVRLVTKSKEVLTCDLSLSLLRDENQTPIGMVGYATDITARKKAEDTLAQQARMVQMGEMLSMIAHQWRQPLNAIALTSANLKLQFDFDEFNLKTDEGVGHCREELMQKLGNIEDYVDTLSRTIDDFKNFYTTDKENVLITLEEIIEKSLTIIGVSLEKNRVLVEKRYNSNEKVKMHENEVMQVILNILNNAQENFLEREIEKPVITITTQGKDISICDNGKGIEDETINKIFDPYFSTKLDKNGTGLGLYLSKTIIEDHHQGKISVQNRADGVCFRLEFV